MAELTPEVFHNEDVEVAWTGDQQTPLIDIDLHTTRPLASAMDSTVVARVRLTPDEAVAFARSILIQVDRVYRKG